MSYKEKERTLAHAIHLATGKRVELIQDNYCSYDATTENAILEFKIREKYYPEKLLEVEKYVRNIEKANEMGKAFLYIVQDPKGIYVFNASEHGKDIIKMGAVNMNCPKTTAFDNNEHVSKPCYLIPEKYLVQLWTTAQQ